MDAVADHAGCGNGVNARSKNPKRAQFISSILMVEIEASSTARRV
jgi:hypothetical protein